MKILVISTLALILFSCTNNKTFKLNGNIVPAKEGNIVLFDFKDGRPSALDTTSITDGKFKFEGETDLPDLYMLKMEDEQNFNAQLFIEPTQIDLTIYPDSFEANIVIGSKSHDLFKTYLNEIADFNIKQNELRKRYSQAQMMNNPDETEAVMLEYEAVNENLNLYSSNFISKHNDSPISAYIYLIKFFKESTMEELDSILEVFDPSIAESNFVNIIKNRADGLRATSVGSMAPDFTLNDPQGNPISLSSLKGKYILIDFWASWCQPCMMEMPTVKVAYARYKDKGFEILGVSLDRTEDAWLSTIEQNRLSWLHVWDNKPGKEAIVTEQYQITGIPHTILLDKEGKIIAKDLRGEALEEKLSELMD